MHERERKTKVYLNTYIHHPFKV